jgi:hypothetical protein
MDPFSKLLVTTALMALQVGLQMSQRIKGPRLDELHVSTADYGTPMPRFWGIRRFECPIIWAEDLKEVHTTTKTKGGKFDNYKYYGTFAVVIADQEIDDVTRIWLDHRLCYDKTRSGPISLASILQWLSRPVKLGQGRAMRIYTGTETQTADPRMQAWCEDRYGPDSCPAYRGVSYIVFEEIPLEDFGNRIPQITVEAVSVKSANYPSETKTTEQVTANSAFVFSPTGSWMAFDTDSGGQLEWWDVAARTNVGLSPSPNFAVSGAPNSSLASDGTAYQIGAQISGDVYLAVTPPLGNPLLTLTDAASSFIECCRVLENSTGDRNAYGAYSTATAGYLLNESHVAHSQCARDFCVDSSGNFWGLFQPTGTSADFTLENFTGGTSHTITGLVSRASPSTAYVCHVDEYNHFLVVTDGKFYLIDDSTFAIKSSGVALFSGTLVLNNAEQNPYLVSVWRQGTTGFFEQYSLEDASQIQTISYSNWPGFTRAQWAYDPVNHAIWTGETSSSNIHIQYLERIASSGVQLGAIVDDVCGWCALDDKDTTALTQVVQGYSVTQGSGKDMIDPLLTIHDVDARPHDFQVQFVNRGSAPSGTILTEDFVREQTRYTVTIKQDTDLPKKVTFNFADKDHDQQVNTVIAQRPLDAVDSQREETIDLSTYVATTDEAQRFADRYFRRVWNSREQIDLSLTAQYLAKEPADVTTVSLDGATRNVRFDKITLSGGALKCSVIRDETSFSALNTATTGPAMGGRDDEFITLPAMVQGFVIDGPLIADADNDVNPLLYTGAGAWANVTFLGAGIFRGDDGSYDELFATVTTGATWGTANEELPNAIGNVWDRGNSVNVTLQSGSLTSVTEADIDADPSLNLIAFGSTANGYEYLNFTTATLEGDGSYTLSGFKRGRRGTEWACSTHVVGDRWILASSLSNEELGTGDIGDSLSFKAQSIGRAIDAAVAIDIDPYSGATLKPYAPARVKWVYDGTDLQGTIFRRTRVGGTWTATSWTVPLSENSEEYEVDVIVGGSVVRTISVSGTNTFTYTAAMATADGVTLPTTPSIRAYQISDAVGRGYARAA